MDVTVVVAVVAAAGSVLGGGGFFVARATVRAAEATARANRAAAQAAAEPAQRQADLAAFQAIRDGMQGELAELREEMVRVRGLLWSVSRWALRLRDQVADRGGVPEPPPADVDEYYRTGV
ncbi:hypothetical protein [Streptomyces youssoufiensis]